MVLKFFIFAVAFLISCTSEERDSVCDEKSIYYNGCVGGVSSSSGSTQSLDSVSYGDETYATVVIGTQTWMARNLSYNAAGSRCYDNLGNNCATYGRLYDWAAAMDLPSNCNYNTCSEQISTKHKGICPSGWHIPSSADWDALMKAVGGAHTAGRYLKAAWGWNISDVPISSATDKYGFSALPGGHCDNNGYFFYISERGNWWTSSWDNATLAYDRYMEYNYEQVQYAALYKSLSLSVRCVKD